MIQVVRCIQSVIDERWRPISIGFVTSFCPCDEAREYFSNTRILTKQIATSVSFSKIDLLHSTVKLKRKFAGRIRQCPHFYKPSTDLHSFLRIVLLPYITTSRPDIKLAAEIAGMSVRTLQRELNRCGVTYKRLLDQCIYEKASELLLHSNEKIIDVSLSVGFQDPSHFSRSFKRVSGFTPKEFRIANA